MIQRVMALFALVLAPVSVLAGTPPPPFDFAQAQWEQIGNEHQDVQVYRWKAPGQDLFAFKGVGTIDAPLPKVVSVVTDLNRQKEWVPDLGDNRLVEQINPLHRIVYLHIKTPFVIKDRDFVVEGEAQFHPDTRELTFDFHSIKDPRVPETGKVRGEIVRGLYTLRPLDGGRRTELSLQVYLDPKGSVPKWLVNSTQRLYPKRTIEGIRAQAAKPDILEHPWARAAMDGKISNAADLERWLKAQPQS